MKKSVLRIINKLYRFFIRWFPINRTRGLHQAVVLAWASDFTHVREQLPVLTRLQQLQIPVAFVTNKNPILKYLNQHTSVPSGQIKFSGNAEKVLEKTIARQFPKLRYALLGNDFRDDDLQLGKTLHRTRIPYGIITHGMNFLKLDLYNIQADDIYTWADEEKTRFLLQGVAAQRLQVSGSPYFHQLQFDTSAVNNFNQWEQQVRATYNPRSLKILLLAVSGPGHLYTVHEHKQLLTLMNDWAAAHADQWVVWVKLHSKDLPEYYESLANLHIIQSADLPDEVSPLAHLIRLSDVVISGASTSVIEAFVLQKPVIIFDNNPRTNELPFVANDTTCSTSDTGTLSMHLNNLSDNLDFRQQYLNKQNRFIQFHLANQNATGNPAATISKHILQRIQHPLS